MARELTWIQSQVRLVGPTPILQGKNLFIHSFTHLTFSKYVLYTDFVPTPRHWGHHREQTRQQSLPLREVLFPETYMHWWHHQKF